MIIEFKIENAKSKLIERILNPETMNYNGSMTYALGHLKCEDELVNVFRILATQSYESKIHAYQNQTKNQFLAFLLSIPYLIQIRMR